AAALALAAPAAARAGAPVSPRPHTLQIAVPRDAARPFTASDEQLIALVASAADHWRELSEGQISSFTVDPTVDALPPESYSDPCELDALMTGARQAYPASRFSTGPSQAPQHLVVLLPDSCQGRNGLGTLGVARFASGGVVVASTAGSAGKSQQILVHELGHNFGLSHSAGGVCGGIPGDGESGACRVDEYFGYPELMSNEGSSPTIGDHPLPVLGAVFRDHFGLEAPGESLTIDWSAEPERSRFDYELRPRADAAGLRSVRVSDPHTGRRYVLEYRSGTGLDAGAFYAGGGTIEPFRPDGQQFPVTMTPGVAIQEDADPPLTSAGGSRMPVWIYDLAAGTGNFGAHTTWFTPNRGLRIDVGAIAPGLSAHVQVTVYRTRITATAPPTIVGRAQVGETLHAEVTGWRPAPDRCEHQWLADAVEIPGATGAALTLDAGLQGARLSVRVTCVVDGAEPVAPTTSAATAAVLPAPPAPDAPPPPDAPGPVAPLPLPPAPADGGSRLTATRVTASVARSTVGQAAVVRIAVATSSPGLPADGRVEVRRGPKLLAASSLRGGRATVRLPASLPAGRLRLAVQYTGSHRLRGSRATVTAIRRKAPVRATLRLLRASIGPHDRALVRVDAVAATARPPVTGSLAIAVDGTTIRHVAVARAARTIRLPPLRPGRHRLTVRYSGSNTHATATSAAHTLTVGR
ncbi:Ig-like domain repeat protein, partial [Conexibacter sp. JD483]|uniref:reprolysin-like metallopeptidase n=1 Tax=Conexibacter sp. JD483 TaxID=3064471 RepID=UPI00287094C7